MSRTGNSPRWRAIQAYFTATLSRRTPPLFLGNPAPGAARHSPAVTAAPPPRCLAAVRFPRLPRARPRPRAGPPPPPPPPRARPPPPPPPLPHQAARFHLEFGAKRPPCPS